MRITVITPTLDAARFLPEMLASVGAQGWGDLEHLAIDGGSTDETLDVLRATPGVTVICEPGLGLYAALNRGIEVATGELVAFVNADDVLATGALAALAAPFERDGAVMMSSGGAVVFETKSDGTLGVLATINDSGVKRLREQDVTHGTPILNARLYRRDMLAAIGPFDTRWPRCPDHELLLRVVNARPKRATVDQVVYRYRAHAESLTFRGGIERDLIEEILDLCAVRLRETRTNRHLHGRFRRWNTWGRSYLALRDLRHRDARSAAHELAAGMSVDPFLPFVASLQLAQHVRMRAQHR